LAFSAAFSEDDTPFFPPMAAAGRLSERAAEGDAANGSALATADWEVAQVID